MTTGDPGLNGFTASFDFPFRTSSTDSGSGGKDFPVSIDGNGYVLSLSEQSYRYAYKRESLDILRSVQNPQPHENQFVTPVVWRRLVESWHLGAGQAVFDRDTSSNYRFNDSFGVDPWTRWQVSLLPDTTKLLTSASSTIFVEVLNSVIVVGAGTSLSWISTPTGTPSTSTDTLGSALTDMTTDGQYVYTTHADGTIYKRTGFGAATLVTTLAGVNFAHYGKGWLLAGVGNSLYSIIGGTATLVGTAFQASFQWVDMCEGLNCLYVVGGVGDKWAVYRVSIDPTGTKLLPPVLAAELPNGERTYSVDSYQGYVMVGTQKGLRFGATNSQGDITLGNLVETPYPVRDFEGQSRFVWFGYSDKYAGYTGLGRLSLTDFTAPLTPAYASDLQAATTGEITAVATWSSGSSQRMVFAVAGQGVYMQAATLIQSGWVDQGAVSFQVPDLKIGLYQQIRFKPLVGSIVLSQDIDQSGAFVQLATSNVQGTVSSENSLMYSQLFQSVTPKFTLTRQTTTTGPTLTRWELRAMPNTGRAQRWTLPILIAETLEHGGSTYQRDVQKDIDALIGLVSSGRVFAFREGEQTWSCTADSFEWTPRRLNTDGSAYQGLLILVIQELT